MTDDKHVFVQQHVCIPVWTLNLSEILLEIKYLSTDKRLDQSISCLCLYSFIDGHQTDVYTKQYVRNISINSSKHTHAHKRIPCTVNTIACKKQRQNVCQCGFDLICLRIACRSFINIKCMDLFFHCVCIFCLFFLAAGSSFLITNCILHIILKYKKIIA